VAIVAQEPIDGVETVKAMTLELQRRDPSVTVVLVADLSAEKASAPLGELITQMAREGVLDLGISPAQELAGSSGVVCAVINPQEGGTIEGCDPDLTVPVPVRYI
jgi:hypothetical protein